MLPSPLHSPISSSGVMCTVLLTTLKQWEDNRPIHTIHKYIGLLNGGDYCTLSYLSHG